jgi:hypothetical protein
VDLKERVLEDVFGGRSRTQEADEEVQQLVPIAFDDLAERGTIAVDISLQQGLIRSVGQGRLRVYSPWDATPTFVEKPRPTSLGVITSPRVRSGT